MKPSLTDALRAKLAYTGDNINLSERVNWGRALEHERLTPTLEALIAVVSSAEDALAQIKDQRGLWPAEVDTLADALARLAECVKEGAK